jgi:two-component SAPR family response regulator
MNVLIIEDETLLAKELQATISEVDEEMKVVDMLPSLKVSRKWFLNNPEPDIIFMDVQLSDGISFTLFDEFQLKCPIVFTTAYDHYALRAFKVNSVDYLLKPIIREDLKRAIDKCKTLLHTKNTYPVELNGNHPGNSAIKASIPVQGKVYCASATSMDTDKNFGCRLFLQGEF